MSDNIAGLIVFLIIIAVVVGLILTGRFIASKLFRHDGKSSNLACDFSDEKSRDFTTANMGYNACSIYYRDPNENEEEGT